MLTLCSLFLVPGVTLVPPDVFENSVKEAGGRVDFVFEDDRPFKQCHASTLVETDDGGLLCAWFGGTEESKPDVAIWMSRFDGRNWGAPFRVAKVENTAHWNPVLFRDPRYGYFLFFKVGKRVPVWRTYVMSSPDGKQWSEARELVPGDVGGRGPVKNKPIILSNGTWLAGASTEHGRWSPFADRTEDGGKTWERSADWQIDRKLISGDGAIQPTVWESAPGHVHALLRTSCGKIARADSQDYGKTWSPVYLTTLPNNNSGIDLVALENGRLLLVYNPVGKNWGPRTPLNLAVSDDNGNTWRDIASLETEKGEYSYPAIIRTAKGVALCYTWKRERVRCWQIPLAVLGH